MLEPRMVTLKSALDAQIINFNRITLKLVYILILLLIAIPLLASVKHLNLLTYVYFQYYKLKMHKNYEKKIAHITQLSLNSM